MLRFLIGLFVILHGLVHLWYFTLSQRLVEFKPEMGWSGRSWILTNLLGDSTTRSLAGVLYILATIALLRRRLGEERWAEISAGVFDQLYNSLGDGPVEELYTMHLGVGIK